MHLTNKHTRTLNLLFCKLTFAFVSISIALLRSKCFKQMIFVFVAQWLFCGRRSRVFPVEMEYCKSKQNICTPFKNSIPSRRVAKILHIKQIMRGHINSFPNRGQKLQNWISWYQPAPLNFMFWEADFCWNKIRPFVVVLQEFVEDKIRVEKRQQRMRLSFSWNLATHFFSNWKTIQIYSLETKLKLNCTIFHVFKCFTN